MKHISYKAELSYDLLKVHVGILAQTHRNREFGTEVPDWASAMDTCMFVSSDGYRIASYALPEVGNRSCKETFVRGSNKRNDNDELVFSVAEYERFKKAVIEYNEYFKE